jgi:preprotein translocase subunit SecD
MGVRGKSLAAFLVLVTAVLVAAWYFGFERPILADIPQGMDLRGGVYVVLEGVATPEEPVTLENMRKAVDIIRFRVDELGVGDTTIQLKGEDRIIVGLPGLGDPDKALGVIGRTALLEFLDDEALRLREAGEPYTAIVTGAHLVEARAAIEAGRNVVLLSLNPEGTQRFGDATARLIGRPIHIVLDGEIVQSPIVQDHIPGGNAEISGYGTLAEANEVAIVLNSGALPVELKVIETRSVSATLGQDSVERSGRAAILGVTLVAAYMVLYYRGAGLVANVMLVAYILLLLGLLAAVNAALTLPGIAGIILSVGMAVDAQVIIFERIREELRLGKTLRSAIDAGFNRALPAILDGNVTTLIAAAVLFYLGADRVRGFAVTLSLGIMTSMFTAVVLTRQALGLLVRADLLRARRLFFGV